MTSHVILVAFEVNNPTREGAVKAIEAHLPKPGATIGCWWVAEDDRQDGSDNDSAVFVPQTMTQEAATKRLLAP